MDRRRFLLTSLAAALVAPLTAAAQRGDGVRRIGYLANAPRTPVTDSFWEAFVAGLQEHGWIQPQTIVIERRYVEPGVETAIYQISFPFSAGRTSSDLTATRR